MQSFETFREEWCDEVHRIKSCDLIDDETFIHDAFIRNIARDDEVIKFLESKLGSLERILLPQLILEIKYNVVKWSDTNKQVHMMEAMQNQNEPVAAFVLRLRELATQSNLFSRCGDEYCRIWFPHTCCC